MREVQKAEAETVCEYLPEVFRIVETSAKENTNIDSIFYCLAAELKVQVFQNNLSIKFTKKICFKN